MTLLTQYEAYKRLRESLEEETDRSTLTPAQVEMPEYGEGGSEVGDHLKNVQGSDLDAAKTGNRGPQKEFTHTESTGGFMKTNHDDQEWYKFSDSLTLGTLSDALNLVNKADSIYTNILDQYEGFKNMSPSEIAMTIMQMLNSLSGNALNRIRQQLNPNFIWETLGMGTLPPEKSYRPEEPGEPDRFKSADIQRDPALGIGWSYEDLRSNIRSMQSNYYWYALIKPPFRMDSLVQYDPDKLITDILGESLGMLLTEFKYQKSKLQVKNMQLAYGVEVPIPSSMIPEYDLTLTILDTGDNILQKVMNKYFEEYRDPYGKGIPLPWEWYFDVEIHMFAANRVSGMLEPYHTFNLQCVPSEGSEYYEGSSSPEGEGGKTLSMSVIGFDPGGNSSKLWQ